MIWLVPAEAEDGIDASAKLSEDNGEVNEVTDVEDGEEDDSDDDQDWVLIDLCILFVMTLEF